MKIFINTDSDNLVVGPTVVSTVSTLSFKRSAVVFLEVQFVQGTTVIELPAGSTGIFEVKVSGQYDSDAATGAAAWVKTGTGTSTKYTFTFTLVNAALDALFFVDGSSTNDIAALSLMGEIQWTASGIVHKTPTLKVNIDNDVIKTGDTFPTLPIIAYGVFLPDITALTGGASGDFDAIPTVVLQTGTIIELLIDQGTGLQWLTFVLKAGATAGAGVVTPTDYDGTTNDRRWVGAAGPIGPPGVNGSVWRNGSGAPSNALGANTDYYLNTFTNDVYYKASGTYSIVDNILGLPGTNGTNGIAGAPGAVWRTGSGVPSNGLGIDGDYYLDSNNGDVYQKASGSYSVVANIKGADGVTGIAFLGAVTALSGTNGLDQEVTAGVSTGTAVDIIIVISGVRTRKTFSLQAGAAAGGDPGQVAPADYDAGTNNKHWEQVA